MSDNALPFGKRTLYLLVGVGLASVVFGFALAIFGGSTVSGDHESNSFSESALGHTSFIRFLDALRIPKVVSQNNTESKVSDSFLVLLEPLLHSDNMEQAETILDSASGSLLVLPKWIGEQDPKFKGRIVSASPLNSSAIEEVLHIADPDATLASSSTSIVLQMQEPFVGAPTLPRAQLIQSQLLTPIIGSPDAMLLGRDEERDLWVLSDPDILSNHGLDEGNNASLVAILMHIARADRTVIIDETLHGFLRKPSMWTALFEWPLVILSIQILIAVVLLIWSGTARFGKPLPRSPTFEAGSAYLISNTARLMRVGGHSAHALNRYKRAVLRATQRSLYSAASQDSTQFRAWIARLESQKNISPNLEQIETTISAICAAKNPDPAAILNSAGQLHSWKEEITNGHSRT